MKVGETMNNAGGICVCNYCGAEANAGYHLSSWWCRPCLEKRGVSFDESTHKPPTKDETFLTVDKLLAIKKDFEKNFPRRDHVKDVAVFANWFHQQYGFKIVPKCLPDDCIAVSTRVYSALLGVKI